MINKLFQHKPYEVGLAMSGGGIKGLCHAGVLKALEEVGVKPNIMSGVSAGSIVAAFYADGYTPDEIGDLFADVSFREWTQIRRPTGGIFTIEPFVSFLRPGRPHGFIL